MWVAHVEACALFARSLSEQTNLAVNFRADGTIIVEDALETRPRFCCSYSEEGDELYSQIRIGCDQINFVGPPAAEKISAQVSRALAAPRSSFMRSVKLIAGLKAAPAPAAAPTPADLNPAALRAQINGEN